MNYGLATAEDKNKNIQTENLQSKPLNQIDARPVIDKKYTSENKAGKV